jgi:hypothetical protein
MPPKFKELKGLEWNLLPVNIKPDIERLNKKKFRDLFNMSIKIRKPLRFKL